MLKICLSTIPLLIVLVVMSYFRWMAPANLNIEGLSVTSSIPVPGHWVAEVLGLSIDAPPSFDQFDSEKGTKLLEQTVVVKEATLRLCKPNILRVDLNVRTPIAEIGDCLHTGVDEQGVLFPLFPIYPDYHLPRIYLGAPIIWGQTIDPKWIEMLREYPEICEIDLSNIHQQSLGKRALTLKMATGDWVRLLPESFPESLALYKKIVAQSGPKIDWVDLRIPQ